MVVAFRLKGAGEAKAEWAVITGLDLTGIGVAEEVADIEAALSLVLTVTGTAGAGFAVGPDMDERLLAPDMADAAATAAATTPVRG